MADPTDGVLELAGGPLPSARSIAAELKAQLNRAVLAERERRGDVSLPEDTWPMHRALASVVETCGEYGRAFVTAAKEAGLVAEEELIDVVGEQDGVPNQGMTVPDPDGDVVISLDIRRGHDYDLDALFSAVAFEVLETMEPVAALRRIDAGTMDRDLEEMLANLLVLAMGRLCELGKFTPQVTKVKAFTDTVGRMDGADGVVSTVTSTHKVSSDYRGVKVERKQTKGRKS